jgi:glycolate oxidase iron-sulfur subunit
MENLSNSLNKVLPDDDILSQCIHCGMCLAACPTYEITKLERSSPRGRIKMIKSVARDEMQMSEIFADEMSFCLDCQACETACPAGVKYGIMVEAARVEVDKAGYGSFIGKILKKISLKYILPSKFNLKFTAKLLYIYQNSFMPGLLQKLSAIGLYPEKIIEIDKLAPRVSKRFSDSLIKEITPASGEEKIKTAFLSGCLMNVMFAEINKDTVDVLSASGCRVITPEEQVCCGSLQAHNGDFDTARKLAEKNLRVFSKYEYDYLISNSAGCGAFMKEYAHIFKDDNELSLIAKEFSKKVKDISEFYSDISPPENLKEINEAVTYHDACHLVHSQKISSQPRKVINAIPGVTCNELNESAWCCGSAGIYNVVRYDDSMIILKRKMDNIRESKADVVITGNPGCISQIEYGAKKFNVDVKVVHFATLLKQALNKKDF